MRVRSIAVLLGLALLAVTACQTPARPLEDLTSPVATPPPAAPAAAVAGAKVPEASPSLRPTPFAFLRIETPGPTTPTPAGPPTTPTPAGPPPTPTLAGPPPTPTPTVEPTPAPQLVKATGDLLGKVDDLLAAVRARDNPRALVVQRELLEQLDRVEKAARADRSRFGTQVVEVGRDLRSGATGDLSKLNATRARLGQLLGRTAGASAAKPIADLEAFADQLANRVSEFRKAFETSDTARLLALQTELLGEVDRASEFKDSQSKVAERLRAAVEDIRNGLGGDQSKLRSAELKLREIAGRSETARALPTAASPRASAAATDVRPLASELSNRFEQYVRALRQNDAATAARARSALIEDMSRAEAKLQDNRSEAAAELQAALALIRELLAGDLEKVDDAAGALKRAMNTP